MSKLNRNIQSVLLLICLCIVATACSTAKPAADKTSSTQTTVAKEPVFELYNKVSLGMSKDQVDTALGVTATPETNPNALKNSYNYKDKSGKYGVYVVYNDKNQAYSKTVIYDSPVVLAPYCTKPIKENQADSIKQGMTYKEVTAILGGEGVECSLTGDETDWSKPGVIRRWVNNDGSSIQVIFFSNGTVGIQGALYTP